MACSGPTEVGSESLASQSIEPGGVSRYDERIATLLQQMTLEEKIAQLQHEAPAIERLGIPQYNYWNEALHGVLTSAATSFPSPVALGATWDPALVKRVATAISDEARGINARDGKGLTYWSPVINMARDPRWGRNEESFGEDPRLMSAMGVAFVQGLQGDDPNYLKTVATPKHFALNNSEYNRHTGSSDIDAQLLREYYLPAFEATLAGAKAFSVMAAYNRVNGVPASANTVLLEDILRQEWKFGGYVVSDCDAVADIYTSHNWLVTPAEAAAAALNAGTDLNCGTTYPIGLGDAIQQGLTTEATVDRALTRVLRARFLLGEFDPASEVPYRKIGAEVVESKAHAALALEAAREAVVLLRNESNFLPLDRSKLGSIAVIGPHANTVVLGGYSGTPSRSVSPLAAIREKLASLPNVKIGYAAGARDVSAKDQAAIDEAVALAKQSDVALVFLGTSLGVLREEMDRPDWALPGAQLDLLKAVVAANPKTVLVLVTAGPLGVDWAQANVPAIVTNFYDGQEQGTAIADVLFGDYNPGGKLSATWYKVDAVLPPIGDYDLRKGRTYLYYTEAPLYPFGHGLSYSRFTYDKLSVTPATISTGGQVSVSVEVKNDSTRAGDEVVQLYVRDLESSVTRPIQQLTGFERIHLEPGATQTVTFPVTARDLSFWHVSSHQWQLEPGDFELRVGASAGDIRLKAKLTAANATGGGTAGAAGAKSVGVGGAVGNTQALGGAGGGVGSLPGETSTVTGARPSNSGSGCECRLTQTNHRDAWFTPLWGLCALSLLGRRARCSKRSKRG